MCTTTVKPIAFYPEETCIFISPYEKRGRIVLHLSVDLWRERSTDQAVTWSKIKVILMIFVQMLSAQYFLTLSP